MAALALADPAEALRRLAPAYKAQEGRLERGLLGQPVPKVRYHVRRPASAAAAVALAALVAGGCAARSPEAYGRAVTLVPIASGAPKAKGELLAVDQGRIWVRTKDGVRDFDAGHRPRGARAAAQPHRRVGGAVGARRAGSSRVWP